MKTIDLTPGDSRDYGGLRIRVAAVDTRKKGNQPIEPVVTLELETLDEGNPHSDPSKPKAGARKDGTRKRRKQHSA